MDNFKSGFLALVGKPNAGKSTLLNALIKQKVSIVSPKPQTTRNKVLGIWTEKDCQMVFVDTPGVIRPKTALGKYMEKSIDSGVRDVDCIVYVSDGHKGNNDSEIELITKYGSKNIPLVVVITKTDICQPETLMKELEKLNALPFIKEIYCVSSRKNKNITLLKEGLKKYLCDDVKYFDDDDVTDKSQRFLVCEIIREKILLLCDNEVPHGIGVTINKMEFNPLTKVWDIDAIVTSSLFFFSSTFRLSCDIPAESTLLRLAVTIRSSAVIVFIIYLGPFTVTSILSSLCQKFM